MTSTVVDLAGNRAPQGTMPGAIFTPMIRVDVNAAGIAVEPVEGAPPMDSDTASELICLRLRFSNTRAMDVSAIAIARERGDLGLSPEAGNFSAAVGSPGIPTDPNLETNPDSLGERVGDSYPPEDTVGQYTPDEDAIIAVVPMAKLFVDENHPLDPYSTEFSVSIFLSKPDKEPVPKEPVPAFVANATKEYFTKGKLSLLNNTTFATEPKDNGGNVVGLPVAEQNRYGVFYVLVAPSLSLQNGDGITCALDAAGLPEIEADIKDDTDPSTAYVYYNWGAEGLVVRIPQPALTAEETEDEDGNTTFTFTLNEAYSPDDTGALELPANIEGQIVCQDMVADQVPNRKINDLRPEVNVTGGVELPRPSAFQPIDNRIWSQFPPGFPLVQPEMLSTVDPTDYLIIDGRTHFDAQIFTDPYPAPEVLASGGNMYTWFGFDLAGGWIGGYDWRLSGLNLQVQGLGGLGEIPRDGIDNDLDGLTDEHGVEDTPQDRQLPGRNDDVDFYADMLLPTIDASIPNVTGVNGVVLNNKQRELLVEIQSLPIADSIYDKGWDPVFQVRDVWDDAKNSAGARMENASTTFYSRSAKYYRDIVIPGFDGSSGLTGRLQPELGLKLGTLMAENPERATYFSALIILGALQSRGIDEDGDGEEGSPVVLGFKIADGVDNDEDGGIDEGIDEETRNGVDDDGDGKIDEDVNFVPVFLQIDEELNDYWVDAPGGIDLVYLPGVDYRFVDLNNNGVYDNGRDDQVPPNLDEFQGPGLLSPLADGDPYSPPACYPIDDDLDSEGEDGYPTTPLKGSNGVDDDGDGQTDEGANEDVRDVVFDEYGAGSLYNGAITRAWAYEDGNGNSRLDPGIYTDTTSGGDLPLPPADGVSESLPFIQLEGFSSEDPDKYRMVMAFRDDDGQGPNIPHHLDGMYDFFVGFQIPENMPPGADFQVSILPGSVKLGFDTRQYFSPGRLSYPLTRQDFLLARYPDISNIPHAASGTFVNSPASSNAYQITKRQFAHLQVADGLGYQSPVEVDGGYIGRPYLDSLCKPTVVLAMNAADALPDDFIQVTTQTQVSEARTILNSIRVNFDPVQTDVGLFDPRKDLRPLTNNFFDDADNGQTFVDSGVGLYLDNKAPADPALNFFPEYGAFDPTDTPVLLNLEPLSWNADKNDPVVKAGGYYVVLKPQTGLRIPGTDYYEIPNDQNLQDQDPNRGYDFFICVRTSEFAGARNTFKAFIRPGDINFVNSTNVVGSEAVSHTYTCNVPLFLTTDNGSSRPVIPRSDSIPAMGFNMVDQNSTFYKSGPAKLSLVNLRFENVPATDLAFTPSDLMPLTNRMTSNIPLDWDEDNDGDDRTFPLPDGIDNDGDGLTDEGVGDSLTFNPMRYTSLSGVALFRDMPNSDHNGAFDDPLDPEVINPDLPVYLSGEENFIFPVGTDPYLSVAVDHDPVDPTAPGKGDPVDPDPFETIPTNEIGNNRGPDYFVVIRTSKSISENDDFRVQMGTHDTQMIVGDQIRRVIVGTTVGYMPGATTGLGPVFPNRQPFQYNPLINSTLVPSVNPIVQEPLSPGFLLADGTPYLINMPFDLYEGYKHLSSNIIANLEDGSDIPDLSFLYPAPDDEVSTDDDLDPGTLLVRWSDIDEDSPDAIMTLVYFPIVVDPILGEILPVSPNDSRFDLHVLEGAMTALNSGDDIDNYVIMPYEELPISSDNENVVPETGYGTDVFTWDARTIQPGTYRIGAILNDRDNPAVIIVGGKVVIENDAPILVITEP